LTLSAAPAYILPAFQGFQMTDFALARRNMVDGQLRPNRVTNVDLLTVAGALPRELFLPDRLRAVAYADDDVPLGSGRVLMEPMVLARLVQALQPRKGQKAMVVASGSGYGAALLAGLVDSVVAVEGDVTLARAAEDVFRALSLSNVRQVAGNPEAGVPGSYDLILIEGAVRQVPQSLVDQLAEGGRLVVVMAGAPGTMGVATLMVKEGGIASNRPLFETGTPPLPGFSPPPKFTF
jgi:protein-L-isoaspartate(D-aspartate) O-methyltransferase